MIRPSAVLFAASLLTAGCGYIAPVMTPLANVPARVTDLAAVQRGSFVFVHFTVPSKTTENFDIVKPPMLDLRIGAAAEPFNADEWALRARQIPDVQVNQSLATCRIPTGDWVGKKAVIGVRVVGANGKQAGWSNLQTLPIVPPPDAPAALKTENVRSGVRLTWTGGGSQFRVLRRPPGDTAWTVAATVDSHEWTDVSVDYGKPYTYEVQALVDAGDGKTAESEIGAPVEITPRHEFPPVAPTGVRAIAAPGSIELTWDANTEADLAGYRVYRASGDGAFEKIAEGSQIPSYSDATAEHGKTYRYAITAIDKSGLESPRSTSVEATIQ